MMNMKEAEEMKQNLEYFHFTAKGCFKRVEQNGHKITYSGKTAGVDWEVLYIPHKDGSIEYWLDGCELFDSEEEINDTLLEQFEEEIDSKTCEE